MLRSPTLPPPKDPRAKTMPKSKMYYKEFHYELYSAVISKLEAQFPILTLCSDSWKADHVLAASLLSGLAGERSKLRESHRVTDNSEASDSAPTPAITQKRRLEADEQPAGFVNKKARSDPRQSDFDSASNNDVSDDHAELLKSARNGQHASSSSKRKKKPGKSNKASTKGSSIVSTSVAPASTPIPVLDSSMTAAVPPALSSYTMVPAPLPQAPSASTHIDITFIEVEPSCTFSLSPFFKILIVSQSLILTVQHFL